MRLLRTAEVKFVGSTVAVAGSKLAEISVANLIKTRIAVDAFKPIQKKVIALGHNNLLIVG